jgi:5,10-methylenetetrahydromethanopterin reductase
MTVYGAWAHQVEEAGFDLIMAGESGLIFADPFVSLTLASQHTRSVRLMTTVCNPVTRHVAAMTAACKGLQQASGGRFTLGIGSGDSALRTIGRRESTVANSAAYIAAVKALSSGQPVEWEGHQLEEHWDSWPVPVVVAAEGPRTQRMAGAVADGIILSNALDPDVTAAALDNLRQGAEAAGRQPEQLEVWWQCNLLFAPTREEGLEAVRFLLAGTANHAYRFHLEGKAIPEEIKPRLTAMMEEYDSNFHAQPGAANPNAALLEKYDLLEFLASRGTIAGPPELCVERLTELAEAGITNLLLPQFMADKDTWMRTFSEKVLPHFR